MTYKEHLLEILARDLKWVEKKVNEGIAINALEVRHVLSYLEYTIKEKLEDKPEVK